MRPLRTVPLIALAIAVSLSTLLAAPPEIFGKSAILFDANTGEVLYKKNDTLKAPIASTQKLLTALIVARSGNLQAQLTIPKVATLEEPTKLYLKEGDKYSRLDMINALLVKSANDAAVALAVDNAGSVEAFAKKMNAEARRLGAKNSNFTNPNGLPDERQYSNARDLACIARAVYRNPILRDIINRRTYTFEYASGKVATLTNTNRVLRTYSFCNGMKTGYTILSGHCLVASGSHGGRDVIAVVLKSNKAHVWDDAAKLLEYGLGINRQEFARNEE